ncbi:MAG: DsbA family protein [Rhizobiaceae bacterium]|nr:DsbA family protein [Rhizobiaceae bacterium]
MNFFTKIAASIVVMMGVGNIAVETAKAQEALDKGQIETIIREYLLTNPELLGQMQKAFEAKQLAQQAALQEKTLKDRSELIFSSKYQVEIGNKDAKFKVVEFFDYNCPFCQRAMYDMEKILAEDDDVKFIIKEWPVLGKESYEAHVISLAFTTLMPEKYEEFHTLLLGMKGRKGEADALRIALELGVDEKALREEMTKPYILENLREVNGLATDLGITGTPSYVIGNEVVFGAVGYDQLTARIAKLKEAAKAKE